MPTGTAFNFGSSAYGTPIPSSGFSNTNGTVTALLDDGAISVGDDVVFSGFNASVLTGAGITGNSGFYLGRGLFAGEIGYVFGNSNTVGSNTSFFVAFDNDITTTQSTAVGQWANSPTSLGNADACFAKGTLIAAPGGEVAVETLGLGDMLLTAAGEKVAVKWIGRQSMHKLFSGARMQPVRIRAGALGGGLPHSDLTVTADHGLVIDGLVINASALVNGATIDFVPLAELPTRVTYYHIETEAHDVVLANGAPAETFVDNVGRQAFDNYAEYLELYGAERIIPEMDRPRISSRRLLPDAIRARLGIAAQAPVFEPSRRSA